MSSKYRVLNKTDGQVAATDSRDDTCTLVPRAVGCGLRKLEEVSIEIHLTSMDMPMSYNRNVSESAFQYRRDTYRLPHSTIVTPVSKFVTSKINHSHLTPDQRLAGCLLIFFGSTDCAASWLSSFAGLRINHQPGLLAAVKANKPIEPVESPTAGRRSRGQARNALCGTCAGNRSLKHVVVI